MPNLLFTIGPPRSGKSTYCTNWAKETPNRAIVCADSIRQALGFEYRQENETLVQGIKDTMIRALLDRGQDVIVDGTHSTMPSITRMFSINNNAIPIWIPSFEYYDVTGGKDFQEVCEIFKDKEDYVNELIKRGRETKGEYIVPVINRIVQNIRSLVALTIYCGPVNQNNLDRKNLNFLRKNEQS